MSRSAPRVCIAHADIERVLALTAALPAHGHVILHMRDGSAFEGVVHVRASAQEFMDPHGLEGMNAELTLECAGVPGGIWHVWLDRVAGVEHFDSGLVSEN